MKFESVSFKLQLAFLMNLNDVESVYYLHQKANASVCNQIVYFVFHYKQC